MRKVFIAGAALLLFGCKGPAGSKGDTGQTGLPGHTSTQTLTGSIVSDDFSVTDTRIGMALSVTVYLSDGTSLSESPYYLPGKGVNTYWVGHLSPASVEIVNASMAGATKYEIVLTF